MLACCDLLARARRGIIGTGAVFSAAVPILACARDRAATRNCTFMVHCTIDEQGKAELSSTEILANALETERMTDLYFAVLEQTTARRAHWWKQQCRGRDFYFTARQAKTWKLIDRIV